MRNLVGVMRKVMFNYDSVFVKIPCEAIAIWEQYFGKHIYDARIYSP